uniref:Large ribosomal subunit protein uL10-like insertion domain-containing protein n=1 Tax=Macaca nemestrina TaxID=9545 RepID=A0A2K6CSY7_MACNE
MPRENRATWKSNYFLKIIQLLDNYPKCFIMRADTIHSSLQGKAMVPTGRNTMMRKATQGHLENSPALEKLLPPLQGNVGFAFTKEYLTEIRDLLLANKVPAAARAGAIGPCEVTVPAQNTGLGPEKISFFQALGITTKISRGTTEILSDVFNNGSIYNPEVLDITEETLYSGFLEGVCNVQTGYSPVTSVPHSIISGYKGGLALSVETDYTFPPAEKIMTFLADPSAFVATAPVATTTTAASAAAAAPNKSEDEELEELDEDMGFGLFD